MNTRKRVVRHGLVGGGFVTLLLAASFGLALGVPTTVSTALLFFWLVVVGTAMFAAGRWERVVVGPAVIGWPRIAAFAIVALAVGWTAISVTSLLEGDGVTGLGPVEVVITAGMVGYFAWFARECWVGGARIDEETFAIE
ncbi:hypothetical protein GS429_06565 [Natronorubrum sp. JWXQ-INN-674]|uniref:Uncharacterized protein n=1 Tax=Natronorubrum halalkaliphilum TaxID=2691917 RepID=A0A6B0VKM0_9EURY|nr:hypothetical protein [Natronorubrum halalkaliphilum]MXV61733.1 hypothetical protein [Natronorubrum halalkaliphilum]